MRVSRNVLGCEITGGRGGVLYRILEVWLLSTHRCMTVFEDVGKSGRSSHREFMTKHDTASQRSSGGNPIPGLYM